MANKAKTNYQILLSWTSFGPAFNFLRKMSIVAIAAKNRLSFEKY